MSLEIVDLDAKSFQDLIGRLAETMAQQVKREGAKCISAPDYTFADLYILLRQARYTYDFFFYLNADERRNTDPYWRQEFTFVCAPLVRSLIDGLYNVKSLIADPWSAGALFRKSGYRKMLLDLSEDESRYGDHPKWKTYLKEKRAQISLDLRRCGFEASDVLDKKANPDWPTLGRFLSRDRNSPPDTPSQQFFREFTYGAWRDYSAISHSAFEGLIQVGAFFNRDGHRHEHRNALDAHFPQAMSLHVGRVALLLLCMCSEIQLLFRFGGFNLDERIRMGWKALQPLFEAQEMYESWYGSRLKRLK